MHITFYDDDALFSELAGEWNGLLAESSANGVFSSFEWQSTWWEVYQPGQIWSLAVRDDAGHLQGLAPWFLCSKDPEARKVSQIGCVDVTDYLEVIVRRGQEEAVFTALADYIAQHPEYFSYLELCNIPEAAPVLAWLPNLLQARGLRCAVEVQEVCPVISLPETWGSYIASLDKKNRHELRRKLRRAPNAVWSIAQPGGNIAAELDRFLALMEASSPLKAEFLDDPQHQAFFRAMVPRLLEQGCLQLSFLTIGGDDAATYLNFTVDGRVMVYNSGHNPDLSGYSPGIVLLARLIEHAIQNGYRTFDFLRGDESYKYDLGGQNTRVFKMEISVPERVGTHH